MDDKSSHYGKKIAENIARLARIAYAAATSGPHGAVVATVKESIPMLVKIAVALIIVCVIMPIFFVAAIPCIFFGFEESEDTSIIEMTDKAMELGAIYMGLEVLELIQMDTIVTDLVADYAKDGITIGFIEIINNLDMEDFYWLIAIYSVAYAQDLEAMDGMSIIQLALSRILSFPSLVIETAENVLKIILRVEFNAKEPDVLMTSLGFDDESRIWAECLYETLTISDATATYGGSFAVELPSYGGDTSYNGDTIPGGTQNTTIDISNFTDPTTKNSDDLAAYAIQAWENGWGYVWGTYGNVLTESLFQYKVSQYPDGVGNYADFIWSNWVGGRTTDCAGLIKGYGWLDTSDMTIDYGTNGMMDYTADQIYQNATVSGSMSTMPDTPGIALWKSGHIGVYIGNGYAIEAMGTTYGVVKTEVDGRGWTGWCEVPGITYP